MRSHRPHIALLVFLVTLSAACTGAAAQSDGCTAAAFEKDAAATLASCTTLLKSDLATTDKAQALKIHGRALHRLGRLDEAISDYEAALKLTPDDVQLYLRRGWAYYDKVELEAAYKYAAHALSLNANADEAYDLAGSVMMRLGDLVHAKAMFDDAVRLRPHNLMARFHRYQMFSWMKKFPEALAELDAILELPIAVTRAESVTFHANFGAEWVNFRTGAGLHRAMVLKEMGRIPEATEMYNRVAIEEPSALTLASRAANHNIQGSASEAEILADVEKAIAYDPKHWYPRNVRARVYVDANRYDAAAEEFSAAIKLAPDSGRLRWGRAMALRKLGRIDEATSDVLAAIDVDPNYFVTHKLQELYRRGYLQPVSDDKLIPALRDAVQACMLDERCQ